MRSLDVFVHHHAAVTIDAHFGDVQAANLDFQRRTMPVEDYADDLEHDEGNDRQRDEAGRDADQLCPELRHAAAVKQPGDSSCDAVPAVTVGAIGEQADR